MKKQLLILLSGAIWGFIILNFITEKDTKDNPLTIIILSCFLGILISYFLIYSSKVFDSILSFKNNVGLRIVTSIILQPIISYFLIYLCFILSFTNGVDSSTFLKTYTDELVKLGILIFISTLFFQIIYFAIYSYNNYTNLQINIVKQERKQIELQLSALKSQLSPHFLFNSLNTFSSLMYEDVNKSSIYIRKLAKLYQYSLESYSKAFVSLNEELEFVESYILLIKTRFKNSVDFKILLPPNIYHSKIPPLVLQMLIENAIKHNVLSSKNPLVIVVEKEEHNIVITNNITKTPHNKTSFKIGLKNIKKRYEILSSKQVEILKSDTQFQIKIPIIL